MSDVINIANIAKGAILEQFEIEMEKVLENISDPNTDAVKVREINLKIKFKADENREIINLDCETKAKLAICKPVKTKLVLGRKDGKTFASEFSTDMPGQIEIEPETNLSSNKKVINMK